MNDLAVDKEMSQMVGMKCVSKGIKKHKEKSNEVQESVYCSLNSVLCLILFSKEIAFK